MTFTFQESAQSSSLASGPPPRAMPALAQKRSISPSSDRLDSMSAVTPSSDAASPEIAVARPPLLVEQDSATFLTTGPFRSLSTTRAPSAAKRRASAAPIPLPAPVTTTPAPATESITDLPSATGLRHRSGYRGRPPIGHCTDQLFPGRPSLLARTAAGL